MSAVPHPAAMAWIGTSGWSYPHWDGVLYPTGTRQADRLGIYVRAFPTVELNASFYHWPGDTTFTSWRNRLPEGFRMSIKAPRGLTHGRRLYQPEPWIERIVRAWTLLGDRSAVLLVQLPPDLQRDDMRLGWFLKQLSAAGSVPVAVELRHPSWQHEEVFAILEEYGAAYVVMSGAGLPCILRATAPFVFVRLHGRTHGTCTRAPTPMAAWPGGRSGSASGSVRAVACGPTSTMTAMATPSVMPGR